MIEYPEAVTIAAQMDRALRGWRIAEAVRGSSPHKFAFYNHEAEDYAADLAGRSFCGTRGYMNLILSDLEPGLTLILGGGGERILLHTHIHTVPKKHQLLLRFDNGCYLSVTVQMWGSLQYIRQGEKLPIYTENPGPPPLSPDFTLDSFEALFDEIPLDDPRSVKFFLISKPGIPGIGNGYAQDILFHAGLHPRHRVRDLNASQREQLYYAVRDTITRAVALGGRDTEFDLYGCPGGFIPVLSSKTAGTPCPNCGAAIQKDTFLGGAIYFCPNCQQQES